ncbi:MAG: hypothetical protein ABIT01_00825 [Thermoanaerobaculia bacterium]
MSDTTPPSPRTVVPFAFPRSEDDPDEIDAAELLAQCDVVTASSEWVGQRTKLTLKHRETGTVINVRTYSDEEYWSATVEPDERHSDGEQTEEPDVVHAFEDAALAAYEATDNAPADSLVTAARRVFDASGSDIWVDTKICPESRGGMAHMEAALAALQRALDATAPTP